MKKTILALCTVIVLAGVSPSAARGPNDNSMSYLFFAPQNQAATLPGFVDSMDREGRNVMIEGVNYRLDEDAVFSSNGEAKTIDAVSPGDFVIATIRGSVVLAISLVPKGEGF